MEHEVMKEVDSVLAPFDLTKETFLERLDSFNHYIKVYEDMKRDLINSYKWKFPCPYIPGQKVGDETVIYTTLDLKTGNWKYPMSKI